MAAMSRDGRKQGMRWCRQWRTEERQDEGGKMGAATLPGTEGLKKIKWTFMMKLPIMHTRAKSSSFCHSSQCHWDITIAPSQQQGRNTWKCWIWEKMDKLHLNQKPHTSKKTKTNGRNSLQVSAPCHERSIKGIHPSRMGFLFICPNSTICPVQLYYKCEMGGKIRCKVAVVVQYVECWF